MKLFEKENPKTASNLKCIQMRDKHNRIKNFFLYSLLIFFAIVAPLSVIGQSADTSYAKNIWHNYNGKIGSTPIYMSLYFFQNGDIKGYYVYTKYDNKIPVAGQYMNNQVTLTETVNGQPNGYFKSTRWDSYSSNNCAGTWTDATHKKTIEFTMQSEGTGGSSYEHKYPDFTSDDILENFMKQVKESILSGNAEWIASNIQYPIKVNVSTGTSARVTITSKQQFIEKSALIFNEAYKTKIKNDVPYDIFGNYQGYMLGSGEIWVRPGTNGGIKIIAINN